MLLFFFFPKWIQGTPLLDMERKSGDITIFTHQRMPCVHWKNTRHFMNGGSAEQATQLHTDLLWLATGLCMQDFWCAFRKHTQLPKTTHSNGSLWQNAGNPNKNCGYTALKLLCRETAVGECKSSFTQAIHRRGFHKIALPKISSTFDFTMQ